MTISFYKAILMHLEIFKNEKHINCNCIEFSAHTNLKGKKIINQISQKILYLYLKNAYLIANTIFARLSHLLPNNDGSDCSTCFFVL